MGVDITGVLKRKGEPTEIVSLGKIMEAAWGWGTEDGFSSLIDNHPMHVACIGSWSDDAPWFREAYPAYDDPQACEAYEAARKEAKHRWNKKFSLEHKYLINYSKKEFLDLDLYRYRSSRPFRSRNGQYYLVVVDPLILLTTIGNSVWGGSYYGTCMDLVGAWAYDLLSIEDHIPEGITRECPATFVEVDLTSLADVLNKS